MITLQEYLQESVFDQDLVSKDTGMEYLYGLVDSASVHSNYYIDYLDTKKIKHEFNELSKKFEMKAWNNNRFLAMDRIWKMESDELLRELLYIIVTKVESFNTKNLNKLHRAIEDTIEGYADINKYDFLYINITDNYEHISVWIYFCHKEFGDPEGRDVKRLGRIEMRLREL